jgi:hypothetical protein
MTAKTAFQDLAFCGLYVIKIRKYIIEEKDCPQVMSREGLEELNWTAWLDFDKPTVGNIPEGAGVYKMHASMKIFYIGNSTQNIRQALLDCLSDPCISKATRFSYALTDSADKLKEQLLNEYRSKHNGKLPICMGEE